MDGIGGKEKNLGFRGMICLKLPNAPSNSYNLSDMRMWSGKGLKAIRVHPLIREPGTPPWSLTATYARDPCQKKR